MKKKSYFCWWRKNWLFSLLHCSKIWRTKPYCYFLVVWAKSVRCTKLDLLQDIRKFYGEVFEVYVQTMVDTQKKQQPSMWQHWLTHASFRRTSLANRKWNGNTVTQAADVHDVCKQWSNEWEIISQFSKEAWHFAEFSTFLIFDDVMSNPPCTCFWDLKGATNASLLIPWQGGTPLNNPLIL